MSHYLHVCSTKKQMAMQRILEIGVLRDLLQPNLISSLLTIADSGEAQRIMP